MRDLASIDKPKVDIVLQINYVHGYDIAMHARACTVELAIFWRSPIKHTHTYTYTHTNTHTQTHTLHIVVGIFYKDVLFTCKLYY